MTPNHLHTLMYVNIFLSYFCLPDFLILSLLEDVAYSPSPRTYIMSQGIFMHMDAHSLVVSPLYPNVHMTIYTTKYLDPDVRSGLETLSLAYSAVEIMNP
jgi:hypothetical protein